LYRINKRNLSRICVAGFIGGPIFCTTQQLHYPFADVAVLCSENTSDKKSIVHTLSLKESFLWGMYKKKGLGLLGGIAEERNKIWPRVYIVSRAWLKRELRP